MKEYSEIYAVDFDKTLNMADTYPDLGTPNMELIGFLKNVQKEGDKVILWTCREGERLEEAVRFCEENGLRFDAINNNLRENIDFYKNNSRKVFAHHYIDDKNLQIFGIGEDGGNEAQ